MLTGEKLQINKYNRNKFTMYYYIFCSTHANYYNILTNKFEPILEHFETSLEMMQVAPFYKEKTSKTNLKSSNPQQKEQIINSSKKPKKDPNNISPLSPQKNLQKKSNIKNASDKTCL